MASDIDRESESRALSDQATSSRTQPAATERRAFLAAASAAALGALSPIAARAQETPGVTATEIKIGSTTSLSGPVSALGTINKAQNAYFRMLNETQGGIAGRRINYLITDDGFNPAKTLEQTRRLIEQEEVAFMFAMLGTGPNSAVVKYKTASKVVASATSNFPETLRRNATRCAPQPSFCPRSWAMLRT